MTEQARIGFCDADAAGVRHRGEVAHQIELLKTGAQIAREIRDYREPIRLLEPGEELLIAVNHRERTRMEVIHDLLPPQRGAVGQMCQDEGRLQVYHRAKSDSPDSSYASESAVRCAKRLLELCERLLTARREVRGVKPNTPTSTIGVECATEIEEDHTAHSASEGNSGTVAARGYLPW
jgi:hypothetical protein